MLGDWDSLPTFFVSLNVCLSLQSLQCGRNHVDLLGSESVGRFGILRLLTTTSVLRERHLPSWSGSGFAEQTTTVLFGEKGIVEWQKAGNELLQ